MSKITLNIRDLIMSKDGNYVNGLEEIQHKIQLYAVHKKSIFKTIIKVG